VATKLFGNVKSGATSVSLDALLLKVSDGTPDTGKLATNLTASYRRQGAARVTVTLSDLSALNSTYSSGGVKEDADGVYRMDWPDAAFLAGADYVTLILKDGTTSYYREQVALEANGCDDLAAMLAAFGGLFIAAVVSTATSATSIVVAFTGTAPAAGSLVGLWCNVTNAARAPEKLQILTATAVDSQHVTLTFATPGFIAAPQVNDTVSIG
jgi:hypothetical protein